MDSNPARGTTFVLQRQYSQKKNHNTMYSLIYRAKVLTRNIIGGFPTKAIAVLSFRLLPPLKNKTKTNDKCTSLWKTFNNKRKKWSLDYTEKSVSRVEGSLAYSSYPGQDNFSYISLQNLANSSHEKQKDG